ncbi:MAG: DUF2029 domain-containing protein [Chloroflexota bacterium]|nr:DUF2029 domain-containing protein [Chloroflexota bacterium]
MTAVGRANAFNDFHDYYLAAKLVADGHSPYDVAALAEIARREGLTFLIGTGYSYPLPFALAMLPLTLLPFAAAVLLFNALSLAAFGAAVAWWLRWTFRTVPSLRRQAAIAVLAGAYPPVYGSVANGQANLLVVALLAVGVMLLLAAGTPRRLGGAVAIGLAALVKLVPAILVVPLLLARRARDAVAIAATSAITLSAAILVAPFANGGSQWLVQLFGPDSYFTNQSINGFVSRIVRDSDRTLALSPGAFDPGVVGLAAAAAFALLNAVILWRARNRLVDPSVLAIAFGLAVAGAVIAAPKNSFWNQTALLVPAGLLLWVDLRSGTELASDRLERLLIRLWFGGALIQQVLWMAPPPKAGPAAPVVTLATSTALYGALALWLVFARRLGAPAIVARSRVTPAELHEVDA